MTSLQERVRDQSLALRQLIVTLSETSKQSTYTSSLSSSAAATTTTTAITDLDSLLLRDQLEDANEASLILEQDLAAVTALCLNKAKRCEELSAAVSRLEREKVTLQRMLIDGQETHSSSSLLSFLFLSTTRKESANMTKNNSNNTTTISSISSSSNLFTILKDVLFVFYTILWSIFLHFSSAIMSIIYVAGLAFIAESYVTAPYPTTLPTHSIFKFIIPVNVNFTFLNMYKRGVNFTINNIQDDNIVKGIFSNERIGIVEQLQQIITTILIVHGTNNKEKRYNNKLQETIQITSQEHLLLSQSIRQVIAPLFVSIISILFLLLSTTPSRSRRFVGTLIDVFYSFCASLLLVYPVFMDTNKTIIEESVYKSTENIVYQRINTWVHHSSLSHPISLAVSLFSTALATWTIERWRNSRDLNRPRVSFSESRFINSIESGSFYTLFFNILDASVCVLSVITSASFVLNLLQTGKAGKVPHSRWSFGMWSVNDDPTSVSVGHDLSALSTLLVFYWIAVILNLWDAARKGRIRAYAIRLGLLASGTTDEIENNGRGVGGGRGGSNTSSLSLLQLHEKECAKAETKLIATIFATVIAVLAINIAFIFYVTSSSSMSVSSSLNDKHIGDFLNNSNGVGTIDTGICMNDPSIFSDGIPPVEAINCGTNKVVIEDTQGSTRSTNDKEINDSVILSPGTWLLAITMTMLANRK
jgi:hypothetical protein